MTFSQPVDLLDDVLRRHDFLSQKNRRTCSRTTSFCPPIGRLDRLRRYVECTLRPRHWQLGQHGGRSHATASTKSTAAVTLTASNRTSVPGNSTSSIEQTPRDRELPRVNVPAFAP